MSKRKPEVQDMNEHFAKTHTPGFRNSNNVIDQGFIDLEQTDVSKKYVDENLRDLTYSSSIKEGIYVNK